MAQTTSETVSGAGSGKARATRAALIRSACDFFVEDGYGAVSVRDLARRTKLSSGAIYGHFRNKADLLVAAVNEKLATELEAPQRGKQRGLAESLAAQAKSYRSRAALRALIVEGAAAARIDGDVKDQLRDLQTAKLDEWRAIYRELQQSEHLDPDADMDTLVVFLWAAEAGLGVLEALDVPLPKPAAWSRLIERVVRCVTEDSTTL
jgi:AcrR family transcriptional regulator